MMPFLRAFAWLHWRLAVNSFRGTRRRDAMERISRAGSVILPILLFALLLPVTAALGALSFWAGLKMGGEGRASPLFFLVGRAILGFALALMVIRPAVETAKGTETGLARFILLPIPRRLLHLIEVLSELADPWIFFVVPGALLLPCGLLAAGAPGAAAIALIAGLLIIATFVCFASMISVLLQWLFRARRRAEIMTLIVVIFLSSAGWVPMLVTRHGRGHASEAGTRRGQDTTSAPGLSGRRDTIVPRPPLDPAWLPSSLAWTKVLPSEMYVQSIAAGLERKPQSPLPLGEMAALGGLFYIVSWLSYRRILESPADAGRRRVKGALVIRADRLPGISTEASAIAFAHLRNFVRTVQGKMTVFVSPLAVVALLIFFSRQGSPIGEMVSGVSRFKGVGAGLFCVGMCLLSLQNLTMNQFALDGAGLTLQFLAPLSERDLIVGKAAGTAVLFLGSSTVYSPIAALVFRSWSLPLLLVPPLAGLAAYFLVAPGAAILSALFPKAVDLNRIGGSGNPNQLAAFIGILTCFASLAPPVLLALLGVIVGGSDALALGLVALWCLAAFAASVPLVRLATRVLASRRENLAMVAQGR